MTIYKTFRSIILFNCLLDTLNRFSYCFSLNFCSLYESNQTILYIYFQPLSVIHPPSYQVWMSSDHVILDLAVDVSLTVREDTSSSSDTCTEHAQELVSGRESHFNAHVSYDGISEHCHILLPVPVLLPLFLINFPW